MFTLFAVICIAVISFTGGVAIGVALAQLK